jgi:hypothetical protein
MVSSNLGDLSRRDLYPPEDAVRRKKIEQELKRWGLDIRKCDTILFYPVQYDRYYGKPE